MHEPFWNTPPSAWLLPVRHMCLHAHVLPSMPLQHGTLALQAGIAYQLGGPEQRAWLSTIPCAVRGLCLCSSPTPSKHKASRSLHWRGLQGSARGGHARWGVALACVVYVGASACASACVVCTSLFVHVSWCVSVYNV